MSFITASTNIVRATVRVPNASRVIGIRASVALISTKQPGNKHADATEPVKKDPLKQGHATDSSNLHQKDVQSQSVRGGMGSKERSKQDRTTDKGGKEQLDAAAEGKSRPKPKDTGSGNPEGVGFVDQVGSATGSAKQFEKR